MDKLALEKLIDNLLESQPGLFAKWKDFIRNYKSISDDSITPEFCLNKFIVKGRVNLEYQFKSGVNDLAVLDPDNKLEIDYLMKMALTGKNQVEASTLKKIYSFYLEFQLNEIYTIYLDFNKGIEGYFYKTEINSLLENKTDSNDLLFHSKKIKEYESFIKSFLLKELKLPVMSRTTYEDNRYKEFPLSFATYFNFIFLDRKRPFKIFEEEQSENWRKRAFQMAAGLEGVPYLSFIQGIIKKREYYFNRFEKIKKAFYNHLIHKEEKLEWELRYIRLVERIRKLNSLKRNLYEELEEHYQYDVVAQYNKEIDELKSKERHYKTKELQIRQDIQHLGGDFKPIKKKKGQEIDDNENQFHLFISDPKKKKENNEKIDELIGHYFFNQSQLDMIESDLNDLEKKKEEARQETIINENKSNENLDDEIELVERDLNKLALKEWSQILSFSKVEYDEEILDFLKADEKVLNQIVDELKKAYRTLHEKILMDFYECLKIEIKDKAQINVQRIRFKKNYMPRIFMENEMEISFSDLAVKEKEFFVSLFLLSAFYINFNNKNFPFILFLNKKMLAENLEFHKTKGQVILS